jgi:hypothetical protein
MNKIEPDTSGYMKPPKHSQFKKGKSGNPKGRPRKPADVPAMIERVLKKKVRVAGEDQKITLMNALFHKLRERIVAGDTQAFALRQRLFEVDSKLNPTKSLPPQEATEAKRRFAGRLGLVIGADCRARTLEEHEEYVRNGGQ